MQSFGRLNMLFACLNSTSACFETFFSLPVANWLDIPTTVWLLMGHMTVLCSKLCLCSHTDWDPQYAKLALDLPSVIDRIVHRIEEARELCRATEQSDVLPRALVEPLASMSPMLQHIKHAYELKHAARFGDASGPSSTLPSEMSADEFLDFAQFDFLDDSFWQ